MWWPALNPIGLIVAAVAALAFGVYEVIKHWGAVKKFLTGLWGWIKLGFSKIVDWIKDLWSGLTKVFEKVAGWFGGPDKKVQVTATKDINNNVNIATKSLGDVSSPASAPTTTTSNSGSGKSSAKSGVYNYTYNNTFNINGSGLNARAIADQVIKILKQQSTMAMAN